MLKIVHLVTGAIALLLTLALASKNTGAALLLASFAFANLLIAPIQPTWARGARRQLQGLVSALIVLATAMQAVFIISGVDAPDQFNASLLSVATLFAAVILHLALNLRKVSTKSSPLSQDLSDRETGTVKWFNTSKGFGFISRDSGDDIFVHFRAIRGEGHRVLVEGQRVEFTVVDREKGLQAEDVIAALPDERN
ncbi:cold-shock protein [Denitrificimonas sp. JX-1]|uniref:Cold-shock protein n=1 Tax=Denitrificimonas halotolerans TaxID=3098930 RepID=A0ABU5GSV0_9GAMM|nr:cold-shock protein [Denitrificimonas sp. JX-1]MDY7220053.1 cold-shock protein [Denitrificimonas sp. JX-1]